MGIYNYSSGSWALVLRVIYLINLTGQKWYVTELKWIWPVIVSGDSLEIISSPDAKDWCDLKKNTLKYFIPLLLTSLLWEDNYKANGIFQTKCEHQKLSVEIYSVFVAFVISRDPSQRIHKCWAYKLRGKFQSPHCFVDFHRQINVKKWQYLKICLVEYDKIWQNTCHYITLQSLKTWNLVTVEQKIFVTQTNFTWWCLC